MQHCSQTQVRGAPAWPSSGCVRTPQSWGTSHLESQLPPPDHCWNTPIQILQSFVQTVLTSFQTLCRLFLGTHPPCGECCNQHVHPWPKGWPGGLFEGGVPVHFGHGRGLRELAGTRESRGDGLWNRGWEPDSAFSECHIWNAISQN